MLFGDMFDYENCQKSNYEILEDLPLTEYLITNPDYNYLVSPKKTIGFPGSRY